jgi:hypothetical protein
MGRDKVEQFCQARPDVSAILICPGQRSGSIELVPFGLAEEDLRVL